MKFGTLSQTRPNGKVNALTKEQEIDTVFKRYGLLVYNSKQHRKDTNMIILQVT